MATLLPNGKQVFLDANGSPLAGGSVQFFVPGTTTPKDTYQDAGATVLNTNPVVLDAAGRATIYGTGAYRQIVRDASGNTIWDQNTLDTSSTSSSWAAHSAGTANAQTLTATSFTSSDGQSITFIASATNTGALSLNVNSVGGIAVLKDGATGPTALSGGEVVAGNVVTVTYDATLGNFHLTNRAAPGYAGTIASAATTDLGSVGNNTLTITGTNAITSFGTSASLGNPVFFLTFAAALTLTYNATSLILPGAANIATAAGDSAIALYLGSGNWRVLSYAKANGNFAAPSRTGNAGKVLTNDGTADLWGSAINNGTSQATTSGTSIDFTGIPSWAKRVTVLFNSVSTSGTNPLLIQLGNGAVVTTGYVSQSGAVSAASTGILTSTVGFVIDNNIAANNCYGTYTFCLFSGTTWVGSSAVVFTGGATQYATVSGGSIALSSALDRLRITTVGGTDTFDLGSVNITWE